jgi:hypothetical protein
MNRSAALHTAWVLGGMVFAGGDGAARAQGVPACSEEVVFDFSPFEPGAVLGEYFNVTTLAGQIVNAKVEAVFVSNEDEPWVMSVGFYFPTGSTGVDSESNGWSGTGTFSTTFETPNLNGELYPPDGQFSAWFLTFAGGKFEDLRGGGSVVSPMDGYFETLKLTLTFGICLFGDLNEDFVVDGADLGILLSAWGECDGTCAADLNHDGDVNGADLGDLLSVWGSVYCPPPLC